MRKERTPTTITIPIKSHLKKFYLTTYDLTEPVKLEEDHILGSYVMSVLQDKRGHLNNLSHLAGYKSELMNDTLLVILSKPMMERSHQIIKLVRINIFLQHIFKLSVIVFIKASMKSGYNAYQGCKMFLEAYKFDESDYSLDGIHQIWKRDRNKHLKKKPNMSTKEAPAV